MFITPLESIFTLVCYQFSSAAHFSEFFNEEKKARSISRFFYGLFNPWRVYAAVRNDYYALGGYFYFIMHISVVPPLISLRFLIKKKKARCISRFFYGLFNPWRVYAAVRNDYYTLGGYFYLSMRISVVLSLISLRFFNEKRRRDVFHVSSKGYLTLGGFMP